jgi:hypothetical protein
MEQGLATAIESNKESLQNISEAEVEALGWSWF